MISLGQDVRSYGTLPYVVQLLTELLYCSDILVSDHVALGETINGHWPVRISQSMVYFLDWTLSPSFRRTDTLRLTLLSMYRLWISTPIIALCVLNTCIMISSRTRIYYVEFDRGVKC